MTNRQFAVQTATLKSIEAARAQLSASSGVSTFVFSSKEATESLPQVISNDQTACTQMSLLGKRNVSMRGARSDFIKKLKEESPYRACVEVGHWWSDRPGCRDKVRNKGIHSQSPETWTKTRVKEVV